MAVASQLTSKETQLGTSDTLSLLSLLCQHGTMGCPYQMNLTILLGVPILKLKLSMSCWPFGVVVADLRSRSAGCSVILPGLTWRERVKSEGGQRLGKVAS